MKRSLKQFVILSIAAAFVFTFTEPVDSKGTRSFRTSSPVKISTPKANTSKKTTSKKTVHKQNTTTTSSVPETTTQKKTKKKSKKKSSPVIYKVREKVNGKWRTRACTRKEFENQHNDCKELVYEVYKLNEEYREG